MATNRTMQKIAFTKAIAEHGNVRRAMREVGLTSPTTAYRWQEARRVHGPEWHTRPPRKPNAISREIVDQVIALAEARPHIGKKQIVSELTRLHRHQVISPNGVQSVLRDAGLWTPGSIVHQSATNDPLDHDRTLAQVQRGIQLDIYGNPLAATAVLDPTLRNIVGRDSSAVRNLLRLPELGTWLQRGVLQFGHALIDTGRWRSALTWLAWLDQWLADDESLPPSRQRSYQEQGRWFAGRDEPGWLAADRDLVIKGGLPMESVSLRQADVWLEAQQYLALILRDKPGGATIERLSSAKRAIDEEMPWYVTPVKRQHYRGIIGHDLGVAQIRAEWPVPAIMDNLRRAAEDIEPSGNVGMQASAWAHIAQAHLLAAGREPHRRRVHHGRALDASHFALELVSTERSFVLRTNIWTSVTETVVAIGSLQADDLERIRAVAAHAIAHGMAEKARVLLDNPALRPLVTDYVPDLATLGGRQTGTSIDS